MSITDYDQTSLSPGFASDDTDQRNGEGVKLERLTLSVHSVKDTLSL